MLSYNQLVRYLRLNGYQETPQIHQSGDFKVLGDTISCWPVDSRYIWRFHFLGEELEGAEYLNQNQKWEIRQPPVAIPENSVSTKHGKILPGEYIVHPFHGVGIFERRESRADPDGNQQSFISLLYAGNDRLLFPLARQAELMPYIGSRHPRLTRLYSKSWQRTKEKVQKDLIKVARELLRIYAARHQAEREVYPVATEWQEVLAKEAGFTLTEDQERALTEIEADLSRSYPMDRLLCGDVGFGKTEVALRAATRVLAAGKQIAFIAPTTVLAEQHFALLQRRLASLPVRLGHLSRLTGDNTKETLLSLAGGEIDLLVGTHRLLGKDVQFKDLGMLILDEEQKFGVAQKELLKKIRPQIDVLSLSATPIPRTLSLSLSGLRGLSLLRTAPAGRKPVETIVQPYQEERLRQALREELKRGGQIYVVHNRVQSLGVVRARVIQLLKKDGFQVEAWEEKQPAKKDVVRVALAHGQMGELNLAKTMSSFLGGEIEVLVASSIVEHGLDSPTANTLIVLHSEWFGLSDLYQLRGRVGRRLIQAKGYFFIGGVERGGYQEESEQLPINETARKRLAALVEADELGSGWSVALRDLEIRGGGNILGNEQHGNMEAIGLLLYAQLLQEEIGWQAHKLAIPLFQFKQTEE